MRGLIAAALLALASPTTAQTAAPVAPDYADPANWLCLPGRADTCAAPLATTALSANGYGSTGQVRPAADAPIDCFYVYPTISRDPGMNSDLSPGAEEQAVTLAQFARFASVCRPFAPVYRQLTLASIPAAASGQDLTANFATAYGDVLAAWRHYLQHHNQGRPFVLIGHSQGTIMLARLLASEIEDGPAAERMASAILLGFNVEVPEGRAVGGTFQRSPLCTAPGQTGCVVTFVSFRATNPPPPGSLFGRAASPGMTVACTNPAALAGGSAPLDSYWFTPSAGLLGGMGPMVWSSQGAPPTPFLRTEGLATAACVNRGPVGYLSVLPDADPADARTDAIPGDVVVAGQLVPGWGLHLADISLVQGDLIALVERQAQAFARR